jgi:hypothetical protein
MTQQQQHPIAPPPELVQQWRRSGPADAAVNNAYERHIATCAAQWGADQELEACCKMLYDRYDRVRHATGFPGSDISDWLRAARRPKPLSLKKQALIHFESFAATFETSGGDSDLIRRALEQLND